MRRLFPNLLPGNSSDKIKRLQKMLASGLRRYPRRAWETLLSPARPSESPLEASLLHLPEHDFAAAWLGHGSMAAQFGERTVLVDPVLSHTIGFRVGKRVFGPRRLEHGPFSSERLPEVDFILITHAHFDHLDRPSLELLRSPRTTVITSRGTRKLIPPGFRAVIEARHGEDLALDGISVQVMRPNHWGARWFVDNHREVNSYLVRGRQGSILFTGDTAHTEVFDPLDNVDVAVFGIGCYNPWEHMHATPEQVWSMFQRINARYLFPIHHSTFEMSDEPSHEPLRRLHLAAGEEFERRVITAKPGIVWSERMERE